MLLYRSNGPWTTIGFRIDGNPTRWMNEASSSLLGNSQDAAANGNQNP